MRILRHEAGHAIDTAYRLHYRRRGGSRSSASRARTRSTTSPGPYSRDFVLHLDAWYAQSHPAEDFAETFAVWLSNGNRWRRTYEGWPALQEARLRRRADARDRGSRRRRSARARPSSPLTREHEDARRALRRGSARTTARSIPHVYDRDLQAALLRRRRSTRGGRRRWRFLRRVRPEVREHRWRTGPGCRSTRSTRSCAR